ncbi:MAG: phage virion morphogenesis protein [Alphaproteobacteria bacterium]|nr:phage virion morphogenesis protein [Alphaproteobacteria bacterium]
MTGTTLTRNLSELAGLAGRFDELEKAGRDTAPLMRDISLSLLVSTHRRFELEQDPERKKWRLFSAVTLRERAGGRKAFFKNNRYKARKGTEAKMASAKLLRASNRLFQSITAEHTATTAQVGTNVIYAAIHNFGGQAGRNKKVTIPARQYLGLSTEDDAMIAEAVDDYLSGAWSGA